MPVAKSRVRSIALSFENVSEVQHMDRRAFRTPRKIFATLPPGEATVNLLFDPPTQNSSANRRRKRSRRCRAAGGAWA